MEPFLRKRDKHRKNCYKQYEYNIHAASFEVFYQEVAHFREQADYHVKGEGDVCVGENFVRTVWLFKFEEVIDKEHQEEQRNDNGGVEKQAIGVVGLAGEIM